MSELRISTPDLARAEGIALPTADWRDWGIWGVGLRRAEGRAWGVGWRIWG